MKAFPLGLMVAIVGVFSGGLLIANAQYKAPSQYFRKDSPNRPGQPPGTPGQPSAPQTPPPAPAQPKFKDVAVNSQFYFQVDTNRLHAWTKTSASTAKNQKTGASQTINTETPIQR